MSRKSDENLRGIPMKPYDLVREGLIALGLIAAVVIVLAIGFGSPDYPTVQGEEVAKKQPIAFLKTSADILAGNHSLQDYGPPYNADTANTQKLLGIGPAAWSGVRIPIDPRQDFILGPLARVAILNPNVATALAAFKAASEDAQAAWLKAYSDALENATAANGQAMVPKGDYGPVAVLMEGMLDLGRAGLLEGAIGSDGLLPYTLDTTKALMFFQDDVNEGVADKLDIKGDQWGITHETGGYPGAWWLWPYSIWYQFPSLGSLPNADLVIGLIMTVLFLVLLLLPFIPGLNQLPLLIGFYRIIWRDWYRREEKPGGQHPVS